MFIKQLTGLETRTICNYVRLRHRNFFHSLSRAHCASSGASSSRHTRFRRSSQNGAHLDELVEDSSRTESAGGGGVPLVARTQSLDGVYRDKNDAD